MADFSMWGPAQSGVRLAQQDAQASALAQLTMQDMGAQVRERNAQAFVLEQQASAQQDQQQIMAKAAQKKQQEVPFQQLDQLSQLEGTLTAQALELAPKYPLQAAMVADKLATLSQHREAAKKSIQQQELEKSQAIHQQIDLVAREFSNTHDESSWKAAIDRVEQEGMKEQAMMLRKLPWSEANKKTIVDRSLATKDQLNNEFKAKEAARKEDRDAQERKEWNVKMLAVMAQANANNARADHLEKVGGTTMKPPKGVQKAAENLISMEHPDIEAADKAVHGQELAEKTVDILKDNPKLGEAAALKQAKAQLDAAGTFKNYLRAKPKTPPVDAAVKKTREAEGLPYDPNYRYKKEGGKWYREKL